MIIEIKAWLIVESLLVEAIDWNNGDFFTIEDEVGNEIFSTYSQEEVEEKLNFILSQ